MWKKMKKSVMAIMLVMTLVLCNMEVHAASLSTVNGIVDFQKGNATIHIYGNEGQSLKGKKMVLYKLFNAENSADSESIQYTMNPVYAEALKVVVGSRIMKAAERVTEYEVIDYLQSLNQHKVEGAQTVQASEGRYSDYRYFMEELLSKMKTMKLTGTEIYINDTKIDNSVEIGGLEYGYYFIEEISSAEGTHSAISLSMLGTANPESAMYIKSDYPTVIKKIQEDDLKDTIGNDGWNDIGDFEIGQDVPYKYESQIPNINGYHNYYYAWHDVMDEALTLQTDSIQITITGQVGAANKTYQLSNSEYNLIKDKSNTTFVIEITNIKSIIDREFPNMNEREENSYGQKVVVEYKATLNEKAMKNTGRPGFENDVRLEFSNNPNQGHEEETGFTPWDTVVCFTYSLNGIKVNNYSEPLEGANFKLYSDAQCKKEVFVKKIEDKYCVVNPDIWEGDTLQNAVTIVSNSKGEFEIYGLDSGTYYLKEEKAPQGYRTLLDPIVLTVAPLYTSERNTYVKGEGAGDKVMQLSATAHIKTFLDGIYKEKDSALEVDSDQGIMNLSVVNEVGKKLPVTGSSAMLLLGVSGVLLMVAACARGLKRHE